MVNAADDAPARKRESARMSPHISAALIEVHSADIARSVREHHSVPVAPKQRRERTWHAGRVRRGLVRLHLSPARS